ncbi:MAG: DUF7317 family protein [Halobacteriota archaeon]
MHARSLTTALTLYGSGTLSLSQAATRAGLADSTMAATLRAYGIPVRETPSAESLPTDDRGTTAI